MKAVILRKFGPSDVLELADVPRPEPGPGDVLVEVHAASVNPRDWLIRSGRYPFRALLPRFPFILGSDVSGVVAAVGGRVRDFHEGQEVYAMVPSSRGFGGYAELVAVPAAAVAPKPSNMSHAEAAGVPLAGLTARQGLLEDAGLQPGQRVLILGASGGVGSYAVQIAKSHGVDVTGVCSTKNLDFVRDLGADRVIDYTREPFLDTGEIYDAVFDVIGKESLRRCASVLTQSGVYVTTIPRPRMFRDSLLSRLRSLVLGPGRRSRVVLVRSRGAELTELTRLAEDGKLRTHVDRLFPLAEAAAAHDASRTFRTRGKLVLAVKN
jgi:NADPH:quinone reductase-like Zn-dependent oxidoreductase